MFSLIFRKTEVCLLSGKSHQQSIQGDIPNIIMHHLQNVTIWFKDDLNNDNGLYKMVYQIMCTSYLCNTDDICYQGSVENNLFVITIKGQLT